jgi:hypothetical protein
MKVQTLVLIFAITASLKIPTLAGTEGAIFAGALAGEIPPRSSAAMTGSEFAGLIASMDGESREQAILDELKCGNMPQFLRRLKPVTLRQTLDNGRVATVTIFVMPDYLAIGSDADFLRVPMALPTAVEIANSFGFVLPTRRMVDAIFEQSAFQLAPEPMPAGPMMRSTAYYWRHNQKINRQAATRGVRLGALVSGHKKDVVLSDRLNRCGKKVAIYGWHRHCGDPIQPLSTVHGAEYADYSHGVRLISDTILLDGVPRSIYRVLGDDHLAGMLSDEGVIHGAHWLMMSLAREQAGPSRTF